MTVIGVRYPELDSCQRGVTCFGNYLLHEQYSRGGFLPVFWNAPKSYMHASWIWVLWWSGLLNSFVLPLVKMDRALLSFTTETAWLIPLLVLNGSRNPRVSSCADMASILAQTKIGFLSGGRSRSFRQLDDSEKTAQREEAFARARVTLTRAQKLRVIMSPFDMRGLIGAATVIGCLKYGAGFDLETLKAALTFTLKRL